MERLGIMRLVPGLFLLAALAWLPGAAASGAVSEHESNDDGTHATAATLEGTGPAVVHATGATAGIWPTVGEEVGLQLSIPAGQWTFVDEVSQGRIKSPANPDSREALAASGSDRREDNHGLQDSHLFAGTVRDPDATVLILPLQAGPSTTIETDGAFRVQPGSAQVLESSHALTDAAVVVTTTQFEYYEYAVDASINWAGEGNATVEVRGDFAVYFWGIDLAISSPSGDEVHRTGFQSQPDSSGLARDDHYRYAVVEVRGGRAFVSLPASQLTLFATSIGIETEGTSEFSGTAGAFRTSAGSYETTSGRVTAVGGSYMVAYEQGGLAVRIVEEPSHVSGSTGVFVPNPEMRPAWFFPALMGGVAVVTGSAAAFAYPSVRGVGHLRRMEALTGDPRPGGWRKTRAEGYAVMGANAEDAGNPMRSILWMSLAHRLDPHDPHKTLDLAIFHAGVGHHRRALKLFQAAHTGLQEAGERDDVAHNSYEAARSAAALERNDGALDWLRIAIEADPALASRAAQDPAFVQLRNEPDYASLRGPVRT